MTMMNIKEETKLETLVEASKNTSEEFKKINERLRKLRDKAETNIAFVSYEYQEMIDIHLPNLIITEFNIISYQPFTFLRHWFKTFTYVSPGFVPLAYSLSHNHRRMFVKLVGFEECGNIA